MGVSSLVLFMNSLEFCNAVVQVAHPLVRSQLLDYLHNGFLVPVIGPALHKVAKGTVFVRKAAVSLTAFNCAHITIIILHIFSSFETP